MCIYVHIKHPLFSSDFEENWIFSTDFKNCTNISFYESPPCGSRVVLCRLTDGQIWLRMESPFAILRTRLKTRILLSVVAIIKDGPSLETVLHIVALHGPFNLRLQWKSMSCDFWLAKGTDCIYLQTEAKLGTYVSLWLSTYDLFRNY